MARWSPRDASRTGAAPESVAAARSSRAGSRRAPPDGAGSKVKFRVGRVVILVLARIATAYGAHPVVDLGGVVHFLQLRPLLVAPLEGVELDNPTARPIFREMVQNDPPTAAGSTA